MTFFSVPFDPAASEMAVGCAIEESQVLLVANIVELPPLPMSVRLGHDQLERPSGVDEALRAPAELAASFGVQVERLLVRSPRPVTALVELAAERRPGLLILGAESSQLTHRFSKRAWKAARDDTDCLVWRPGDEDGTVPEAME